MPMHDFNLLSQNNIPKDRKEGKDSRERSLSIDNKKRYMIDLETIREISNTSPPFIGVRDDDDFVAAIDEFG